MHPRIRYTFLGKEKLKIKEEGLKKLMGVKIDKSPLI